MDVFVFPSLISVSSSSGTITRKILSSIPIVSTRFSKFILTLFSYPEYVCITYQFVSISIFSPPLLFCFLRIFLFYYSYMYALFLFLFLIKRRCLNQRTVFSRNKNKHIKKPGIAGFSSFIYLFTMYYSIYSHQLFTNGKLFNNCVIPKSTTAKKTATKATVAITVTV